MKSMHVSLIIKGREGGLKTTMEEDTEGELCNVFFINFFGFQILQCACFFKVLFLD